VEPRLACRAFARACSEAIAYDASIPRPGASSTTRPQPNPDPSSLVAASPRAYEVCLRACTGAYMGFYDTWVKVWYRAVVDLAREGWGNPAMGSLFLLSLQAASLGYSLARLSSDNLHAIMGSSRILIEHAGVKATVLFFKALRRLLPSYLGRLSWDGLPDASTTLAVEEVEEKRITLAELLDKASLYDPVSKDAARYFQLSLGEALPVLIEYRCRLGEGILKAYLYVLAAERDFIAFRKAGIDLRGLAREAYEGFASAEGRLWRLLKASGAGSSADIIVAALARLLYEAELGRFRVAFTGC
jgi:hypothetical protein